jgi:PPP family 3-phenylpropionic acid transporter
MDAFPLIWPLGLGIGGFFGVQTLHAISVAVVLISFTEDDRRNCPKSKPAPRKGSPISPTAFGRGDAGVRSSLRTLRRDGFFAMVPIA